MKFINSPLFFYRIDLYSFIRVIVPNLLIDKISLKKYNLVESIIMLISRF